MARDRVVERGAKMRSFAVVAREMRIGVRDIRQRALRHGQSLERGLRTVAATYGQLEDLGLAAVGRHLQIALGAVDLPEQVRAARTPAAIVNRERGPALEQPADAPLIVRGHGLALA